MQTTQENTAPANPLERRIDMAVPLADIDREVETHLKRMSRTTKVPGFRPGKVPLKIMAQQYGAQARSEAIGAAVEKAFGALVREQNLQVAGYPRIEPKNTPSATHLEFSAVFEIYPEFALGDVSSREIEKPTLAVAEADVDKTLEVLRKQRTTFVPAGRPAAKGDRMVIDFTGRKDGAEFEGGKAADYTVMLGAGMMLPDFETGLEGAAEGDEKTFDVAFPADYHATDLAGHTVQFTVKVKQVEAPMLPEIDAEFARSLGVPDGDLAKMRSEIRANLEREVKKRLQSKVKQQVMDALIESNPIDVPRSLVEIESRQMADGALKNLEQRGMSSKNMPVEPSWFTEQATRRVKLGLIIAELVKEKDLHAKPEQVRAVIDDFASTFEKPEEVVRWYYSQPQRLSEAEALALENNVVEWALAQAKVTEKAIGFDELMENEA